MKSGKARKNKNVYLFYKREKGKRWICAIAKKLNDEGFLITTYPTDAVKEGNTVWKK